MAKLIVESEHYVIDVLLRSDEPDEEAHALTRELVSMEQTLLAERQYLDGEPESDVDQRYRYGFILPTESNPNSGPGPVSGGQVNPKVIAAAYAKGWIREDGEGDGSGGRRLRVWWAAG